MVDVVDHVGGRPQPTRASQRPRRVPLSAEVALASGAGAGAFAVVAVTLAVVDSGILVVGLGLVCIAAVVAIGRLSGVAFAVPVALASLLAYDWFQFPPTHPLEFQDSANLADLVANLAVAVLVGEFAANARLRTDVAELARSELLEQQAALRRVATLVARESPAGEIFAVVAEEVGRVLQVQETMMIRYEPDATATVVASWGELDTAIAVGTNWNLEGDNVSATVHRTRRPARIDDYANATGSLATSLRSLGIRSAVATPIVVGRRLWGAMIAVSRQADPLPASTESRIGEFTELVATAISNIQARSELSASRARILGAADEERRRVVRDLHDGAQQGLVHTVMTLKMACQALPNQEHAAPALVTEALAQAERAIEELRELAHGILPTVLTRGGLRAGVDSLALRMPMPVENGISVGRLPAALEATAYFVVAEALTNVAKHARAGCAAVTARIEDGTLRVHVRDDGVGGARPDGSGLLGLADRVAALDGRLQVESPVDGGTLVAADIPVPG